MSDTRTKYEEITAEKAARRIDLIAQNGNDGLHYLEKEKQNINELTYLEWKSSKYHVNCKGIQIDVYDVLNAFEVTNPGIQHAIKKLLKGGERGYKDTKQDYNEAIKSINRGIELTNK